MKRVKLLKKILSVGKLFVLVLFIAACKKDDKAIDNPLLGNWTEDPSTITRPRSLTFSKDSVWYFIERPSATKQGAYYKGTYTVKGNKLLTRFTASNLILDYAGPKPQFSYIFEDATYEVNETRLTIHHTTYPADAPVTTTAVYIRNINQ